MADNLYTPRNELVDMNAEMNAKLDAVREVLMAIPGVVSVGLGLRERKGEFFREMVYVANVWKKLPKSDIPSSQVIPDTLFGFPVDVRVLGQLQACEDSNKYRPIIGGCQVQPNNSSGIGTLGCFATRNLDSKIVLLSNFHVLVGAGNGTAHNSEGIGQPTHSGCCSCCSCNEFAQVVDAKNDANMDAAIALLHGQGSDTVPDEKYMAEVLSIGYLAGSAAALAGERVWKYGRTTNETSGTITSLASGGSTPYPFYTGSPSVARANDIQITPDNPPYPNYLVEGDSGSVSINEHNQVVGLNYARGGSIGYANHITAVIAAPPAGLGITILDTTFHPGTGKSGIPLRSGAKPHMPSLAEAFAELDTELAHYAEGRKMMSLFDRHREEMMTLVNKNREVMAAWNRYHGPAHLAHLARSIRRDNKPLPPNVKGITLQNLVLKMAAVLQRNGSPELSQAVSENYLNVMGVLDAGNSPEAWRAYLERTTQDIKTNG